mmetsp:Transcript_48575/g.122243  ORF Transcript_48575/g.122243 Transcript_48575/m.122243 type:complete len:200 (+) Transcript_48575:64-663(+)
MYSWARTCTHTHKYNNTQRWCGDAVQGGQWRCTHGHPPHTPTHSHKYIAQLLMRRRFWRSQWQPRSLCLASLVGQALAPGGGPVSTQHSVLVHARHSHGLCLWGSARGARQGGGEAACAGAPCAGKERRPACPQAACPQRDGGSTAGLPAGAQGTLCGVRWLPTTGGLSVPSPEYARRPWHQHPPAPSAQTRSLARRNA